MDQASVSYFGRNGRDNKVTSPVINRRPVEVTVNRICTDRQSQRWYHRTDINNNQARLLVHPVNPVITIRSRMSQPIKMDLPMVSLCFSIIQVAIYFSREAIGVTSEDKVYVSWRTVITQREVWRLLYAHFFHFGRVHIFFNIVTLMSIGRYLEKRIKKGALAVLILVMATISNLLYIFINGLLCEGPHNEYTVGFSTAMFSLRMIHIFTMDSEANNGKGDPNLIFGFLPVHLPPYISPWQPVIETIFFDVFVIGRCVAATVSGIFAGLLFPHLMKKYRNHIMLPRNPPPPPPKFRSRRTISQRPRDNNNNDDDDTDDMNANRHSHND